MIYELIIEDENVDEVFAISLVEEPAIESNFVFFDKEKIQFAALSDDKRLVMGAILIPNKQILRIDGEGKPYHVFFKPETIKKLSEMYLKKKYTDSSTLEHDKKINGVTLVESWVKESLTKDKSSLYGLNAPVGSWMGTFKIDNDEIWNDYVKTGEVKGFSIEGLFGHNLVAAAAENYMFKDIDELNEDEAKAILNKIHSLLIDNGVQLEQPSVASSYPGEAASGSIAPALLSEAGNMNVFGIETEYFQICPGALELFTNLISMPMDEDTKGMVRSAALQADRVFGIEEDVLEDGKAEPKDLGQAIQLVKDFKDLMGEIDKITGMKHDVSFMDGHIKVIKELL
jgi:hypothetical protein